MTLKYNDLKAWLAPQLSESPVFSPGPIVPQLEQISPDEILYLVRVGRSGFDTDEKLFERLIFQAYVISGQNDYDSGEALIYEVDQIMLNIAAGTKIGDTYVSSIDAAGNGPRLIAWDTAQRYHFTCSYEFLAER